MKSTVRFVNTVLTFIFLLTFGTLMLSFTESIFRNKYLIFFRYFSLQRTHVYTQIKLLQFTVCILCLLNNKQYWHRKTRSMQQEWDNEGRGWRGGNNVSTRSDGADYWVKTTLRVSAITCKNAQIKSFLLFFFQRLGRGKAPCITGSTWKIRSLPIIWPQCIYYLH